MKKLFLMLLFSVLSAGVYAQTLGDALVAMEAEKYERAQDILESLIKANPQDGLYQFHMGNLYLILGEDAKARESFERGITLKKNSQINHIGLGRILLDDGRADEAAAEFAKATYKLKKKDTDTYLYISKAYYDSFNPDYPKAAEYARKVLERNPKSALGNLALGDAEFKMENLNEAYKAYRNAFGFDNTLLRAKLNLAIITKAAHAFPEAIRSLDEIIELDPAYAPTYRELAEIYYLWATMDRGSYDEHISKALGFYEQYMQLTDYSLESRMRHADFLVLAKDYEALEKEAAEMQKIDHVNPRILRYLGYSAYENRNYVDAIEALTTFLNTIDSRRALGIDYAYLAKAEIKTMDMSEGTPLDIAKLSRIVDAIAKAVEKEAPMEDEFSDFGVRLYRAREYAHAAEVFGALINTPNARLMDMMYFANSIFYFVANLEEEARENHIPEMERADSVYAALIEASPTTQDTYYNRARLNRYIPGAEEKTVELFREYIRVVSEKGEDELAKPLTRRKISDAYTSIGAHYADIDIKQAIAYFQQALEFDPENEDALLRLNFLQKQ